MQTGPLQTFMCSSITLKPDLDSVGLGWALRVCIFNQLPGDTGALVLGSHLSK